ncbi:SDR family oxidoreductase [Kitasatospora sp. NPDC017646]|uniref:SDR family oxidoreductase n=1 Tax=Kitasatospora sp. NPDC017646 TaxID=3364024 RepID=UPI0037A1D213
MRWWRAGALGDGVDAVYLMWPGIPVRPRIVEPIAEHAERVVHLSTDVPDAADDEPPAIFHQEIERLIRKSGLGWTFVRAIDFAGNVLAWADKVRAGVVRWPYGQARRSLIHERDIADVVVRALTEDGHEGAKYLVTGPEAIAHAAEHLLHGVRHPARSFRSWVREHAEDFR